MSTTNAQNDDSFLGINSPKFSVFNVSPTNRQTMFAEAFDQDEIADEDSHNSGSSYVLRQN